MVEADQAQMAFWTVNAVIDVLNQNLIALAPVYLLFHLQLSPGNKHVAMVAITPNLTYDCVKDKICHALTRYRTILLARLRLVYLFQANNFSDLTMTSSNAALTTIIYANYSIIASCLSFLKPMVDSLVVGLLTNDVSVPVDSEESLQKTNRVNPFAILSGRHFNARSGYGGTKSQTSGYTATATAGKRNDIELLNIERYGSQDRIVIGQTKETVVDSEPKKSEP